MTSLQALHQLIGESLSRHKFLLVLDDVWDEKSSKWDNLSKCLMPCEPESIILVTTRKEEVASIMGTTSLNILKPRHISDSDCWFLMSQIAFQGRTNMDNELEKIGKEIAKKCKGLPLAAKTLGGMLRSKKYVDEWKEILNSKIWESKLAKVKLFPHIFLSYQELPPVLKRCFLILAIFPKDTKLEVERVISIWMAHGLLNQGTKEVDMVKTCKKYLAFLVSRALLEEQEYIGISMHDILHDFVLHLSGDELISITVRDNIENDSSSESTSNGCSSLKPRTMRHLFIDGKDPVSIGFNFEKLRTCIIQKVAPNVTSDLVKRIKMVRALYLVSCKLKQVPQGIEKLIHLRVLDLTYNYLSELPETIGNLYNLQQLLLKYSSLSSLPNSMGKLTNLIVLEIDALEKLPESVGKLIKLQNLGEVEVGDRNNKLGLLKNINQLRGSIQINFNSDYGDEVDAKKAAIGRKKYITELTLHFHEHKVTDDVIAALQSHPNLQVLNILDMSRSCDMLPSWIISLEHLTKLAVHGGGNVSTLPPLGKLQSLKKLAIQKFNSLKIIGREFIGLDSEPDKNCSYFPKLVELRFGNCDELTGWEDLKPEVEEDSISVMPNLQILKFFRCGKLDKLPHRLLGQASSLETISIEEKYTHFKLDVGESPCKLDLEQKARTMKMIVEGSTKVPKSIIFHSYVTLLDLYFADQPMSYLPPMEKLPCLQSLSIRLFAGLEVVGRDFLGIDDPNNDEDFVAFPNLLKLKIRDCYLLKEWEDLKPEEECKVTVMPKLQGLQIKWCEKLQVLPSRLLCGAPNLEEINCYRNNDSLAENIMKDEQLLRHVKSVYVDDQQCSLHPSTKSETERGSGSIESFH